MVAKVRTTKERRDSLDRQRVMEALVGYMREGAPKTMEQIMAETKLPYTRVRKVVTTHQKIECTRIGRKKAYYTKLVGMSLL